MATAGSEQPYYVLLSCSLRVTGARHDHWRRALAVEFLGQGAGAGAQQLAPPRKLLWVDDSRELCDGLIVDDRGAGLLDRGGGPEEFDDAGEVAVRGSDPFGQPRRPDREGRRGRCGLGSHPRAAAVDLGGARPVGIRLAADLPDFGRLAEEAKGEGGLFGREADVARARHQEHERRCARPQQTRVRLEFNLQRLAQRIEVQRRHLLLERDEVGRHERRRLGGLDGDARRRSEADSRGTDPREGSEGSKDG